MEQPLLRRTAGASLKLISKVNNIESVKGPVGNNLSKNGKVHTLLIMSKLQTAVYTRPK